MSFRILKLISVIILFSVLILFNFQAFAQNSDLNPSEERADLEKELTELEKLIDQYESDVTKTQEEKKTLQNQIYTLKNRIEKLTLQISQGNVMIKDLNIQIEDTQGSIEKVSQKIDDLREKLGNILMTIYEEDQKSILEIFLGEEELSDFFDNIVALESLNMRSHELLGDIKNLKVYLGEQEYSLSEEKGDLENTVAIQLLQKQNLSSTKTDQEYVLTETKGKEAEYQKYLKETKEKATEIKNRIFELIDVPEAPTFGEALEIARYAESVTGIRPAFLLAILTQESNIGKNVGQCFLPKDEAENKRRRVMHPTRDVPPFLIITKELGRDPYNTPISCPMSYGWGGAMGPSQFIPSTWALYKDKVKEVTGKASDPWNIKDAFLATGLYLKDLGGANNEWKSAMHYFSGARWNKYEEFYGDSVIALANRYQGDIDAIEEANSN